MLKLLLDMSIGSSELVWLFHDLWRDQIARRPFGKRCVGFSMNTVDGRNPAPPKKPWNDDCPANANNSWFQPWFESGVRWISSIRRNTYIPFAQEEVLLLH